MNPVTRSGNWKLWVGAGAAMILCAAAIGLSWGQFRRAELAADRFRDRRAQWLDLAGAAPFPDDGNLTAILGDIECLHERRARLRKTFATSAEADDRGVDVAAFKAELDRTIWALNRSARSRGVTLPVHPGGEFAFSFDLERRRFDIPTNAIPFLTRQLRDLSHVCGALIEARVHRLKRVARAPALATDDPSVRAEELTPRRTGTNELTGTIAIPYVVEFNAYSAELGETLNRLRLSPGVYIVKSVALRPENPENPAPSIQTFHHDAASAVARPVPGTRAIASHVGARQGLRGIGVGIGIARPTVGRVGSRGFGLDPRDRALPGHRRARTVRRVREESTTILGSNLLNIQMLIDAIHPWPADDPPVLH